MTDELRNFVREAVGHIYEGGPSPGTPPGTARYGGGDEGLDDGPGGRGWRSESAEGDVNDEDEDAEDDEGLGDEQSIDDEEAAEQVWASLSPAEQAAVDAGDVDLWEAAFLEVFPDALGNDDDDDEDEPTFPPMSPARDSVMALLEDSDGFVYPDGEQVDVDELLAWMVAAPAAEFRAWADEAGWTEAQPGMDDLPSTLALQVTAAKLDDRLEAIRDGRAPYL